MVYKSIYLLGIGGIGMSALARYYNTAGAKVSGYDRTKTKLTQQLTEENINIHYTPDISLIPGDTDIVIYTPAIPQDNPELIHLKNTKVPIIKRSVALASIVNPHFCIAVAGTHGKTTISALISHILKYSQKEVLSFVGGIMKNYNNNLIYSQQPQFCVVEADEYDRTFLNLKPDIAVVSAIDADHLDIYNNYEELFHTFIQFISQLKPGGRLIMHKNINLNIAEINTLKYGAGFNHDMSAENIHIEDGQYRFDIYRENKCIIKNLLSPLPGIHNAENTLAAVQVALLLDISHNIISQALESFIGIERRYDYRIKNDELIYIDDYAHHPKEIETFIESVISLYPNKEITGVFQPHLYSRTKHFADDFARSLEKLDKLLITDIYPARELPINGINAEFLLHKVNLKHKYYCPLQNLPSEINKLKPQVLLTIGAGGDIAAMTGIIEKTLLNQNIL